MARPLLEVCVDGIEGLIIAQENGADRVELCSALSEGGLTPSFGLIRKAIDVASVPVHVLVRPRGGSFQYTPLEAEVMLADVKLLRDMGIQGVVLGALDDQSGLDLDLIERLIEAAGEMSITFHRAFDEVTDPVGCLQQLRRLGIARVLTSGQQPTGLAGRYRLRDWMAEAQGGPIILGCGSLRPDHIAEVLKVAPLSEIHFAARQVGTDGALFTDGALVMGMRHALAR